VDVTDEVRDATYDSLDDDLIATMRLQGAAYGIDNKQVFAIFKPLLIDGPGWPFIQRFNRTQNGRAAFLALKTQAEGQSAVTTRKAKAYAAIATAVYTGKGRYTIDQYTSHLTKAFNELEVLGEPVAETKKVADFLKGITDPRLSTGKDIVDGDPAKREQYELCQQFFKTLVENNKARSAVGFNQPRQVSGVSSGPKKPPHKKGSKTPKHGPKPKIHGGHYSPADFRALTDDERAQVKALRAAAKLKKSRANNSVLTSDDERQISSVSSAPDEADVPLSPDSIVKKNAGDQFGKRVYKNTDKKVMVTEA
jgi:hypothetical protein